MLVCENCKSKIGSEQPENGRSFPAYSVLGGIAGAAGAAATGIFLLVPAMVIAGAVTDTLTQRCEICNSEISEDEPSYHLMEEVGDALGGQTYRHADKSKPAAQQPQQQSDSWQRQQGFRPTQSTRESGHSDPLNTFEQFDNQPEQCEFVFDETEGKLVQQRQSSEENHNDLSLSNGFDNELTLGFETHQNFGIDDELGTDPADPFSDFQDDSSLDSNPFGLFHEPPVGEL